MKKIRGITALFIAAAIFLSAAPMTPSASIPESVAIVVGHTDGIVTVFNVDKALYSVGLNRNSAVRRFTVTFSPGVTAIEDKAFDFCSTMIGVIIPDSVTSIGNDAFRRCSSLTGMDIPDSVISIGIGAFSQCVSLPAINVGGKNLNYSNIDGVLFNKDRTTLIQFPGGKATEYIIPDSVTSIADSAFLGCTLTSVTIPNSVVSIGDEAFSGCYIKNLTIPNSVVSIGDGAFSGCNSLTSITIPASVTSIGTRAFTGCNKLKSVVIGSGLSHISDFAFSYCYSLTSITIPDNVTSIGESAFGNCTYLTSITIPDSVTSIGRSAFSKCVSLTGAVIGNGVTSIGGGAFGYCDSLTEINVSENNPKYCAVDGVLFNKDRTTLIQYPGGKASEYIIPDSVTTIDDDAFKGSKSLTGIIISDSVTTINNNLFAYCALLSNVIIGNGVTSIGDYAFRSCDSLISAVIGNSVTSIGEYAFYSCASLTSVIIPESMISIGDSAFYNCASLTSAVIPDNVTYIGRGAFVNCASLSTVIIGNSVVYRGGNAFRNCASLTSAVIPDSVLRIGIEAFSGEGLRELWFLGDVPVFEVMSIEEKFDFNVFTKQSGFTIYYIEGKTGWTTPVWKPHSDTVPVRSGPEVKTVPVPTRYISGILAASVWARSGIVSALDKGFVPAEIQGGYTNTITRAEFCRMAVKWVEYAAGKSIDTVLSEKGLARDSNAFTDTNDPDILAAFALGITNGTGVRQFSPDGEFTREQAATMIRNVCRVIGMNTDNPPPSEFADMSSASNWAVDGINFVKAAGIMQGTGNNNFSPAATYTREQSIITFNNIK